MDMRRSASLALGAALLVACSSTKTIGSPGASITTVEGAVTTTASSTTEPPTE
jgi:hypothetical protein